MGVVSRALLEALVVMALAAAFGLAANALSPQRLSLQRDYFADLRQPATPGESGSAPESGSGAEDGRANSAAAAVDPAKFPGKSAEVARGLVERGLQVIDHEAVVALYQSELFAYEAYTFVDARNEKLYHEGHIPSAYLFDPYYLERHVEEVLPACQAVEAVIVYCFGEECTDSEIAARRLLELGVDPQILKVYVGGMKAWLDAGMPVERGERNSGDVQEAGG